MLVVSYRLPITATQDNVTGLWSFGWDEHEVKVCKAEMAGAGPWSRQFQRRLATAVLPPSWAWMRACVRACVHACVRAGVRAGGLTDARPYGRVMGRWAARTVWMYALYCIVL